MRALMIVLAVACSAPTHKPTVVTADADREVAAAIDPTRDVASVVAEVSTDKPASDQVVPW